MLSAPYIILYFRIHRHFSSSSVRSNFSRESRFMRKIIYGKSKRKWYDSTANSYNVINTDSTNKSLSLHTTRRMTVRDKLFMKHITDLISMGEISDVLSENIEITHVKITADFKYLNVFWTSGEAAPDEEALKTSANVIRRKLTELHLIGKVPPVQFVKNIQCSIMQEVERKLETIALEPDIDPLLHEEDNCSDQSQVLSSHINSIDQALHKSADLNDHFEIDKSRAALPVMRHDVLGLDHYKIMSEIVASLSKSKTAAQRRMSDINTISVDDSSCDSSSSRISNFLTKQEQQNMFSEFLKKRKIEEKRRNRAQRSEQKLLYNYDETEDEREEDYEEGYVEDYEDYNKDERCDKFMP